ncbi:hypothetical protein H0H92_010753 [Tricholoma furcatifolium]|nr:hypothetical protein H0H92_010753 [Tricholoma furcatifolium]
MDMANNMDANFGSMLIAVIVSAVLLGVSLVQAFFYFTNYSNDHWVLRALVVLVTLFDIVHLALVSHAIYWYLIVQYGNGEASNIIIWSVLVEVLITGMTGFLVQCFYLTRVWHLSKKNIYLTGLLGLLSIGNIATVFTFTVKALMLKTWFDLVTIKPITLTADALTTVVDILIAASLCWYLSRIRTGFRTSDTMIKKLMLFVINTGLLCALGSFVSILASPTTLVFAAFYFNLGRLYTNSFLASLNARKSIKGTMDDTNHFLVSTPSFLNPRREETTRPHQIAIRVSTQHESRLQEQLTDKKSDSQERMELNTIEDRDDTDKRYSYGEAV